MYRKAKDESQLDTKIKLPIIDGRFIEVYIWKSPEAMHANSDLEPDYAARYVSLPYKIRPLDGHKIIGKKYGEMHLVINEFGAGVFAHELTHFILDYIDVMELDFAEKDQEMICLLVGNMTTDFWNKFYDIYHD